MLSKTPRILNFDNSLLLQEQLVSGYSAHIVDLTRFSSDARMWMNRKTCQSISSALSPELKNAVTFLGSGDYHNVTSLLLEQFKEPLNLIVFDHHPDWDILPPKFGCGSWVSRSLEQPNIKKIILLGISSQDISWPAIKSANLSGLKDNRIEIYPYEHEPTRVFLRRLAPNVSVRLTKKLFSTVINWNQLKNINPDNFIPQLLPRLEASKTYVSIDKDCLNADAACTNWEEGRMPLSMLLLLLGQIRGHLDIVGLDITGEYSQPGFSSIFKSLISRLDHPAGYSAKNKSPQQINSINQATNMAILKALESA